MIINKPPLPPPEAKDRLLTTAEAAQRLNKPERTLSTWRWLLTHPERIAPGREVPDLQWIKLGRSVRYLASSIDAYINAQIQ